MKYLYSEVQEKFPNSIFKCLKNKIIRKLLFILDGKLVGGVVRDGLLGLETFDIDIATPYKPNEVLHTLETNDFHPVATGIKYGTISLFFSDLKIEITSLRKDIKNFGRKAEVEFGGTWEEDSLRRDFTFNSLYLALENEKIVIYDYHKGVEDLLSGSVNFIGSYEARIQEDYLRILRFIRFFIRYSKHQENYKEFLEKFSPLVPSMKLLSIERILMEIFNILKRPNWQLGIQMINDFQISDLFFQEKLLNKKILPEKYIIPYIFLLIDSKIITQLPLQKDIKYNIINYQNFSKNSSLEVGTKIWQKQQNLESLNYILELYNLLEKNIYNTDYTQENFNAFRKKTTIINLSGPERGIEELEIKKKFFEQYIIKC